MIPLISYLLLPGILMVVGGSRWGVLGVVLAMALVDLRVRRCPQGGGLPTSFRLCPVWGRTMSFLLSEVKGGQEKEGDIAVTATKQTNRYPKSTFVTSSLPSLL